MKRLPIELKADDVLLAVGRRQVGKSFLGKKIQENYPRVFVFDVLNEYPTTEGIHVFSWKQFHTQMLKILREKTKTWKMVYHFDLENDDNAAELNQALKILYAIGNMLIVVEEVQHFSTPQAMPHWLKNCLTQGAHRKLAMLFTTQHVGSLNKKVFSQANHVFCGSLHAQGDVDYVRSVLRDRADELYNLAPRNFLYFSPGSPIRTLTTQGRIAFLPQSVTIKP